MNKWLYRAVGVASGALLLSSGVAHAEAASEAKPTVDPQAMRGLLADLFTPTGGQHHLGLSIDTESTQREELLPGLGLIGGAAGNGGILGGLTGGSGSSGLVGSLTGGLTGGLTGSGSSGLLGGLTGGGGPLGGLTGGLTGGDGPLGGLTGGLTGGDGPLGGLTSGLAGTPLGAPLSGLTNGLAGDRAPDDVAGFDTLPAFDQAMMQDLAAANGGVLGTDGPASTDIVDPILAGTALDTSNQRPVILDPAIARQVNDATGPMVNALIADAMAQKAGLPAAEPESAEEALPLVGQMPVLGTLVGPDGPLSQFLVVGSLFDNLPVIGDLSKGGLDLGTVDRLPVVGKIINTGLVQAGDGPKIPVVGSLPLVGTALDSLTKPLNNIGQKNPLGNLGQNALGGLTQPPAATMPAAVPAQVAVPVGQARPVAQRPAAATPAAAPVAQTAKPAHVGKHRAPTTTARPVVVDPEYRDMEETLPLLGDLAGGAGGMGNLPVSSLVRQLPLVSDLPLVNTLDAPLSLVKALPVVGVLAGLVPVESA